MGLQRMNEKKVRKLSALAQMDFVKAGVHSDGLIAEAVTAEDVHYFVDRKTGDVRPKEVNLNGGHWTSCIEERKMSQRRTVWKYEFGLNGDVAIEHLGNPKVVHFDIQEKPEGSLGFFVWVEHQPNAPVELRSTLYLEIVGTGQAVPDGAEHVMSFQRDGYVWHLYDRLP